jgi:hypothetical protein
VPPQLRGPHPTAAAEKKAAEQQQRQQKQRRLRQKSSISFRSARASTSGPECLQRVSSAEVRARATLTPAKPESRPPPETKWRSSKAARLLRRVILGAETKAGKKMALASQLLAAVWAPKRPTSQDFELESDSKAQATTAAGGAIKPRPPRRSGTSGTSKGGRKSLKVGISSDSALPHTADRDASDGDEWIKSWMDEALVQRGAMNDIYATLAQVTARSVHGGITDPPFDPRQRTEAGRKQMAEEEKKAAAKAKVMRAERAIETFTHLFAQPQHAQASDGSDGGDGDGGPGRPRARALRTGQHVLSGHMAMK